jgi:hypothetical protein
VFFGISNFDQTNRGESQWDDRKLKPNIYWTHLRTGATIGGIMRPPEENEEEEQDFEDGDDEFEGEDEGE